MLLKTKESDNQPLWLGLYVSELCGAISTDLHVFWLKSFKYLEAIFKLKCEEVNKLCITFRMPTLTRRIKANLEFRVSIG